MSDAALNVVGLHKSFGSIHAVNDVSMRIEPGEVYGLMGPDGAGKTTSMRMICGLVRQDGGEISVLGHRIPEKRREARAHMGYMPQQYSLYGDLSVQENLRFFARMFGVSRKVLIEREKRLLDIARLDRFRDRPARALSGGMYKKLALACALVHEPRLLLLDEPTNGVDPISRRELWAFLYELVGEGVAVLVSTPYMDEAERCSKVGLLLDGRIVASDSPASLKQSFTQTLFEIETSPVLTDVSGLLALDGVSQAYLMGRAMHVISPHGVEYSEILKQKIISWGSEVVRLDIVTPSFEDIFMHITSEKLPDAKVAQ